MLTTLSVLLLPMLFTAQQTRGAPGLTPHVWVLQDHGYPCVLHPEGPFVWLRPGSGAAPAVGQAAALEGAVGIDGRGPGSLSPSRE